MGRNCFSRLTQPELSVQICIDPRHVRKIVIAFSDRSAIVEVHDLGLTSSHACFICIYRLLMTP